MGVIYAIDCAGNGKRYIGSTQEETKRRGAHFNGLRRGVHANRHLQNAWYKYGAGAFAFTVLERVQASADLLVAEQRHIDAYPRTGLFNQRHKAESNHGISHTAATRRKIAATLAGRVFTPEHREKLSVAGKARAARGLEMHQPDAQLRAAIGKVGKKHSVPRTLAFRERMAEIRRTTPPTRLGIPCSPEARARISAAKIARNAERRRQQSAA